MLLTSATVEDADASVAAVVDLVEAQVRVAIRLDPDTSHRIVKDLIPLQYTETLILHKIKDM